MDSRTTARTTLFFIERLACISKSLIMAFYWARSRSSFCLWFMLVMELRWFLMLSSSTSCLLPYKLKMIFWTIGEDLAAALIPSYKTMSEDSSSTSNSPIFSSSMFSSWKLSFKSLPLSWSVPPSELPSLLISPFLSDLRSLSYPRFSREKFCFGSIILWSSWMLSEMSKSCSDSSK